jgi:lysyl-tRNA synthetase class I
MPTPYDIICPNCGSTNVTETDDVDYAGYVEFECGDCEARFIEQVE